VLASAKTSEDGLNALLCQQNEDRKLVMVMYAYVQAIVPATLENVLGLTAFRVSWGIAGPHLFLDELVLII